MIRVFGASGRSLGAFDDFTTSDLAAPWLYVGRNAYDNAGEVINDAVGEAGRRAAEGALPVITTAADQQLDRTVKILQGVAAVGGLVVAVALYLHETKKGRGR